MRRVFWWLSLVSNAALVMFGVLVIARALAGGDGVEPGVAVATAVGFMLLAINFAYLMLTRSDV